MDIKEFNIPVYLWGTIKIKADTFQEAISIVEDANEEEGFDFSSLEKTMVESIDWEGIESEE